MADWKQLTKAVILANGGIEEREADLIKKEMLSDGVIKKSETEFLIDLRNSVPKAVKKFHEFVFEVVKRAILADGDISPIEAAWLQRFVLADGTVDAMERAFLLDLKKSAKKTCPEFEALLKKHAV